MARILRTVGGFCIGFGGTGVLLEHVAHTPHTAYNLPLFLLGLLMAVVGFITA
jgi:hypothetical protein